jgi:hypothetical protein
MNKFWKYLLLVLIIFCSGFWMVFNEFQYLFAGTTTHEQMYKRIAVKLVGVWGVLIYLWATLLD